MTRERSDVPAAQGEPAGDQRRDRPQCQDRRPGPRSVGAGEVRLVADAGDACPWRTRSSRGPAAGPPAHLAGRGLDRLTDREREVLLLIARGLSNHEIAGHLHLSLATVKTHIGRLLSKLDARDRAQLVMAAYESGLVRPGTHPG